MKQPLFSVVIPAYNRPKMLERAVESVFAQSISDWELIVVDDGSEPALELEQKRSSGRVRLVRQTNAGPGAARKTGLALAQGRYFCLLDDDDYFFPEHLARLANELERLQYLEVVLRTNLVGKYEQIPGTPPKSPEGGLTKAPLHSGIPPSGAERELTNWKSVASPSTSHYPSYDNHKDSLWQYWKSPCGITSLCFPRSVIKRVPIDPAPRIIEDFAWLSRVFTHYDLHQIEGPATVAYVQHPSNRTLIAMAPEKVAERLAVVEKAYNYPGVAQRIPQWLKNRLLQHQLCHAARQCFLAGKRQRGWGYFWRATRFGVWGWRDLLGVVWVSCK